LRSILLEPVLHLSNHRSVYLAAIPYRPIIVGRDNSWRVKA
jgi:hypothetical protein